MLSRRSWRVGVVLFIATFLLYLMLPYEVKYTVMKELGQHLTDAFNSLMRQGESDNFTGFEPEVVEDFPTEEDHKPKIPHIIHFIFITDIKGVEGIPAFYKRNVDTFSKFNSNWTYYFWTDELARQLIKSKHPTLLPTWDNYERVITKADALRYILLYEFGGVYSDLDVKCMRPLDRATMKFSCILTPEPFEHSAILYRMSFILSNGFMMCRPKHPFMKQAIKYLSNSANKPGLSAKAGPIFLTETFKAYMKYRPALRKETYNSPYFYKWFDGGINVNSVYISNTHYFMNSPDSRVNFLINCYQAQDEIMKRGCLILKKRKHQKNLKSYSFVDHKWAHIYSIAKTTHMLPMQNVIPSSSLILYDAQN